MDGMSKIKNKVLDSLTDGDVVGFSGCGFVSDSINVGTYGIPRWNLSHVGIISSYRGNRYLFESTTTNKGVPCEILGKPISGVQAHRLTDILRRPGKVWKYPLAETLSCQHKQVLLLRLLSYLGTPYDYKGAARTGGFLLRLIEGSLHNQDISQFFCSELVAIALTEVGSASIINASGQSPNSLVRRLKRRGICKSRVRIK